MSAICECGWSGTSTQVCDGGRCPDCDRRVRYDSKPLLAAPKLDVEEFNHRAARALRAVVDVGANPFLASVLPICEDGLRLSPPQQNGLYKTVLRHAEAITDRALIDFATMHGRGAD